MERELPPAGRDDLLASRPKSLGAPRSVYVKSYGCQMNVYDAQRMVDTLAADGYVEAESPEEADLVILNTCHIREKAAEKVYSEIGRIRVLKEERLGTNRPLMLAVAGCVAQAEGREIVRRAPAVDLVFGPQNYHHLPDLVARAADRPGVVDTEVPDEDKFDHLPAPSAAKTLSRGLSAFLTIQEGCDKFCSFCVVPYTRGAEISRPAARIVAEAERLAEAGVRELTLIGQNVNAYHGAGPGGRAMTLAALCYRLADVPGIARIRYTTSHPNDMGEDLIAAHRDLPALMPYLHLPVQAGSDRILAAMNRKHTADHYRRIVEKIRDARPDIALSSDFIVGFPGESDADFEATMRLVEDIGFAAAYSFKYSPRPGTPAAGKDGQVPEAVKDERLQRLQALINRQLTDFNASLVGRIVDVLFEKAGKKPGQMVGRSPYVQAVHVQGPQSLAGTIAPVAITGRGTYTLNGELIDSGAARRMAEVA